MDMERVICPCLDLTIADIKEAIDNGASSFAEVQEATSAGTVCEECVEDLEEVVNELLNER